MLAIAQKRAPNIKFIQQDIRTFNTEGYDVVLCLFVFNHLKREESFELLKKLNNKYLFIGLPEGDGEDYYEDSLAPDKRGFWSFYTKEEIKNYLHDYDLLIDEKYFEPDNHNELFITAIK